MPWAWSENPVPTLAKWSKFPNIVQKHFFHPCKSQCSRINQNANFISQDFFHFSLFIYNFNSSTKIPTSSFLDQHTSQFLDKSISMPKYLVFGQTFINWTTVPRWKLALPRENSHLSTCSGLDLKNGMHTFWVTALVGWQCATCTMKVFLILPFDFDVGIHPFNLPP